MREVRMRPGQGSARRGWDSHLSIQATSKARAWAQRRSVLVSWSIFSSCEQSLVGGWGQFARIYRVSSPQGRHNSSLAATCDPNPIPYPECLTWCDERRPIPWAVTREIKMITYK